jgi:hypothetical protein
MLAFALVMLSTIVARAAEETIKPEELPKAVAEALKARFPQGKITSAAKEEDEKSVVYDIELVEHERKFETDIKEDGTMLEVEKEIKIKDLPAAITKAVETEHSKATILEVMEVNKVERKKEKPDHYEINLQLADGNKEEILLSLDGKPFKE